MHHKGQKLLGKMAYITYLLAVVKTAGLVLCIYINNIVFFWTFEIESLVSATFSNNWLQLACEFQGILLYSEFLFYCIQNTELFCAFDIPFEQMEGFFSKLLCLLLDFRSGLLLKGLTFWSPIEITKNCIISVLFMIFTRGFLHSVP